MQRARKTSNAFWSVVHTSCFAPLCALPAETHNHRSSLGSSCILAPMRRLPMANDVCGFKPPSNTNLGARRALSHPWQKPRPCSPSLDPCRQHLERHQLAVRYYNAFVSNCGNTAYHRQPTERTREPMCIDRISHETLGQAWLALLSHTVRAGACVHDEILELRDVYVTFSCASESDPLLRRHADQDHIKEMRKVFFTREPTPCIVQSDFRSGDRPRTRMLYSQPRSLPRQRMAFGASLRSCDG